jgi:predicted DsbA family dithiol-disulfide isomerase
MSTQTTKTAVHTDPGFPVVVFGDFICPWSYAVRPLVQTLAEKHGLRPWWRPHLLRPDTPVEGTPYEDTSRREATLAWFKEMAPETVERMHFPDRVRHTFTAFQGLEFADDHEKGWEYAGAVFEALWVDGADIADHCVLQTAAASAGLDPEAFGRALDDSVYRDRATAAARKAVALDVTATPTMILGRTRVNGWHYLEVLESIVAQQHPTEPNPT